MQGPSLTGRRVQLVLDIHSFCVCVRVREQNLRFCFNRGSWVRGEKMFLTIL